MEIEATGVEELVRAEILRITDVSSRQAIARLLVAARVEHREWDYGAPGQTHPCWIVLEHPPSNTGIAYCEHGFGPAFPWGLLFLAGEQLSMGMDAAWYETLEEAFRDSMACDAP